MEGFMEEKKAGLSESPIGFSVIQVRGVTLVSRQFQSAPGETRPPAEVKVGVSPAPKGIFCPWLEIQQFF